MCGLVFIYHDGLDPARIQARTQRALDAIRHRGPDEQGHESGGAWSLGHQRLSIVDLGSSHQPMYSPDGSYVLAYNGEVYNYRELREQLEPHWQFRTDGDTEVVLAGLVTRGPAFLSAMEGMWALALWNTASRGLLLSRDRMGKKPLYYQHDANGFACASELPALHALGLAEFSENEDSTADYLRYGFFLPGTTAYSGVREVLPGHWLEWRPGNGPVEQHYWELRPAPFSATVADARTQLQQVLADAVNKRMVADVEVGAFLSGGIDSSLIVALLDRKAGVTPKTFSIGFVEASYDERAFARMVAEQYGTDHYEECLQNWSPQTLVNLILDHVGEPFYDASLLPTTLVSELASRHVKVALSGDGGDELFSGYQRYQARILMRWYTRLPKILRKTAEQAVRALPEPMAHHSRSILKKAHLFMDAVNRYQDETPYTAPMLYTRSEFGRLAPGLQGRGHRPPVLPEECRTDDIVQMMCADALTYLPQDVMLKVDRASMAHSLEARAPFLDRAVVELAFSLPGTWHRRGMSGKHMLKEAFAEYLPARIWQRRKQGFGVPLYTWFTGGLGDELQGMLGGVTGPLEHDQVLRMLREHRDRVRDNSYRLWNIYVYLLFLQGHRFGRT